MGTSLKELLNEKTVEHVGGDSWVTIAELIDCARLLADSQENLWIEVADPENSAKLFGKDNGPIKVTGVYVDSHCRAITLYVEGRETDRIKIKWGRLAKQVFGCEIFLIWAEAWTGSEVGPWE